MRRPCLKGDQSTTLAREWLHSVLAWNCRIRKRNVFRLGKLGSI